MHIDDLIRDIKPHIPFNSEEIAQKYIDRLDQDDQIALISALYIGRNHIHSDKINDDHIEYLLSGEMDRHWEKDNITKNMFARILYEKNTNLTNYYDSFIRCATNSGYDLHNF